MVRPVRNALTAGQGTADSGHDEAPLVTLLAMDREPAALFDAVVRRVELPAGVRLERLDYLAHAGEIESVFARAFSESPAVPREALYDERTRERADQLMELEGAGMLHHFYGFLSGDELIGVYEGRQERRAEYDMRRTALLPEWRRRGIYTAFLPKVVEAARAAGFLRVSSRHAVDNNAILVPKLAHGFVIEGFVTSLRSGLQVVLVYHLTEAARAQHRRVVGP